MVDKVIDTVWMEGNAEFEFEIDCEPSSEIAALYISVAILYFQGNLES